MSIIVSSFFKKKKDSTEWCYEIRLCDYFSDLLVYMLQLIHYLENLQIREILNGMSKPRATPILLKRDSASAPTLLSMRKRNEQKKVHPLHRRLRSHNLVALEPLFESAESSMFRQVGFGADVY
jgi:hypothetical protein